MGGRRTDARGGAPGDSEVRAHCAEQFCQPAEIVFRRALAERRRGGIAGRGRVCLRDFCAGGGFFHCRGLWGAGGEIRATQAASIAWRQADGCAGRDGRGLGSPGPLHGKILRHRRGCFSADACGEAAERDSWPRPLSGFLRGWRAFSLSWLVGMGGGKRNYAGNPAAIANSAPNCRARQSKKANQPQAKNQRPFHTGGRFSAKARAPSLLSSLPYKTSTDANWRRAIRFIAS